jgi:hypothetical protein
VEDVPKNFGGKSHSITFPTENFSIPLELRGLISFFPVRTLTLSEIENCFAVVLTPEPEWDPYAVTYQNAEREFSIKICQTQEQEIEDEMIPRIINMSQVNVKDKSLFLSSEQLARTWAIPESIARDTIKATTQNFIRSALHPIERRFRTKNTMLRYNQLQIKMYSDTFFSNCTSILGNKCAQLFVSDFGYIKFAPMKLKSEAGYTLQELIKDIGIPKQLHIDGAKKLTMGKWKEDVLWHVHRAPSYYGTTVVNIRQSYVIE